MNIDYQLKEHLKRVSTFASFKLNLLKDDISKSERFDISDFKVKYLLLELTDFKDSHLVQELLALGDKIIDLKNK